MKRFVNLDLNFDFSEETSEFERNISTLGLLALLNEIEKKEQLKKIGLVIDKKFGRERSNSIGCTEEVKNLKVKSTDLRTQSEPSSLSNLSQNLAKSLNGDKFDGFVFNTDLSKEVNFYENSAVRDEGTDAAVPSVKEHHSETTISTHTDNKCAIDEQDVSNDGLILVNDNYLIPLVISEGEIEEKSSSKTTENTDNRSALHFENFLHDISPGLCSEDEFSSSDNADNGDELFKDRDGLSSDKEFSDGSNEFDAACGHPTAPTAKFDDSVNFLGSPTSDVDTYLRNSNEKYFKDSDHRDKRDIENSPNLNFRICDRLPEVTIENYVISKHNGANNSETHSIADNDSRFVCPMDEVASCLRMSSSLNQLNSLKGDDDSQITSSQTPLYNLRRRSTESSFALAENISSSWSSIEDIEAVASLFDLERQRLNKLFKIDAINHSINVITRTLKLSRSKNERDVPDLASGPSKAQNLFFSTDKRNSVLLRRELLKSEVEIVKKSIELLEKDILELHNSLNSVTSDHRKDFCTIMRKSELLEEKRRRFEDLEFSLVELESKCDSDIEDNLLSDLSINGSRIINKEEISENHALKIERQELLNQLRKEHRHLAMIEKKMHRLKKRFDDTFRRNNNGSLLANNESSHDDQTYSANSHIIQPMPMSYFRWKKDSPNFSKFYNCEPRISSQQNFDLSFSGNSFVSERIRPKQPSLDATVPFDNKLNGTRKCKKNNSQSQIFSTVDDYKQTEDGVRLRFPSKKQERPLTRYLPVAASDFNLEQHVENAGHFIDPRSGVLITKSTCSGYLIKMGQKFRTWHKRWFVFDRNKRHLAYYSEFSYEDKEPRGKIDFQSICEVYVDHLNSVRSPCPRNTFVVKTLTRPFYLVAPSVEAMRVWVDVIITGAEGHLQYQA